ncbi:hypothetical protein DL764_008667 [Monosporascus ibericus]|uniref:SGF29 C-terminal domain-containing protein n=1 Tax=Monosporascus ibericus TaxID=155417 RepID=A0A4Q4SX03_9PEZI|nr:hypothetical protein DL764_008667 [Monosporascus ibericus]
MCADQRKKQGSKAVPPELQSTLGAYWQPNPKTTAELSSQPSALATSPVARGHLETVAPPNDKGEGRSKREPSPTSSPSHRTANPVKDQPLPVRNSNMSSQRSRPRGPNRTSEAGGHGEELQVWEDIKKLLPGAIGAFNDSSSNVLSIRDQDKAVAEKKEKSDIMMEDYNKLDNQLRKGVKINDAAGQSISSIIEQLKILKAVVHAKEQEQEQSTSRSSTQRVKESAASSSVYDFDGAGDSPVPSPNPPTARRMGASSSKGDRDSVPPKMDRSTPAAKAGSVEPQTANAASVMRSKVTFAKEDEVAFKPKPVNNEHTDWILGFVQEVRGEGKSRRYKVLDAEPEEHSVKKDFRTSASNMIPIPKDGTVLPPLETGKTVLAMYPDSTTFYKAEVLGMAPDGKVNLKFEGDESLMQAVVRRYVVEYRG